MQLLQEHGLPLPASDGIADSYLLNSQFIETLMQAPNEAEVQALIEQRASLFRSACDWTSRQRHVPIRRPQSKDQMAAAYGHGGKPIRDGKEFAAAVRGN